MTEKPGRARVEISKKALRDIRTWPATEAAVRAAAERVARAAGPGFVAKQAAYRENRARFFVVPVTSEAHRANAKDYAVLRGLAREAE